jgi:hypothetical protein
MSQTSTSSSFRSLLDAALQDYANQTGIKLDDHPLAELLERCNSADSMFSVLQEHAQSFREICEDGKIMKSLKSVIHILYDLSNSSAFGDGTGIVCPKALIANVLFLMCIP